MLFSNLAYLVKYMYSLHTHVLSRFIHARLFRDPKTVAQQAPLSLGFSSQEHWNGLPCPSPGDLPDPGIEPSSLISLALAGEFFTTSAPWEAPIQPPLSIFSKTNRQSLEKVQFKFYVSYSELYLLSIASRHLPPFCPV